MLRPVLYVDGREFTICYKGHVIKINE